ncbi:hypothetical protein NQ152_15540 [Microbacterium sp. zg.B48]|uniref:hypothetical protein n=1 Tax=Microbacterium sp. zg.B48 TaxID=2969408 RepID=UPI00214C06A5|nr:hypothetical protein [Microbacterium sp. zg.B48]MCR2764923.1 hypothetical protein [Microbacterium sp. zg.B48]
MGTWHRHAEIVAEGFRRLPELHITPDPPHISEFWVSSELPAAALEAAVEEHRVASGDRWLHGWWTDDRAPP